MKSTNTQYPNLVDLIETTPWGDIEAAVESVEDALRRAMLATGEDFAYWEQQAAEHGFDEFRVMPWEVAAMSEEMRLVYAARMLRTIALHYGLGTEYGGDSGLPQDHRGSLAPLLHDLIEIASHSTREVAARRAIAEVERALDAASRDPIHRGWYLTKSEAQAQALLAVIRELQQARERGDV